MTKHLLRTTFAGASILSGCAHAAAATPSADLSFADAVARCTAAAEARDPSMEIHTVGAHVTRGGVVIGVAVETPQDLRLQQCLLAVPSQAARYLAADPRPSEQSVGLGGFSVDVGHVPEGRRSEDEVGTTLARHQALSRGLVEDLVSRELLSANDPFVEQVLASSPHREP